MQESHFGSVQLNVGWYAEYLYKASVSDGTTKYKTYMKSRWSYKYLYVAKPHCGANRLERSTHKETLVVSMLRDKLDDTVIKPTNLLQ